MNDRALQDLDHFFYWAILLSGDFSDGAAVGFRG